MARNVSNVTGQFYFRLKLATPTLMTDFKLGTAYHEITPSHCLPEAKDNASYWAAPARMNKVRIKVRFNARL